MLAELRKHWRIFKNGRPGSRFQKLYEARKESGGPARIAFLAVGILLFAGGVVLLVIPGPGLPLIAFGAALLAQQSLWLARLLDRAEPILRRLVRKAVAAWKHAATPVKAAIVSVGGLGAAAAAYVGYLWFFKR